MWFHFRVCLHSFSLWLHGDTFCYELKHLGISPFRCKWHIPPSPKLLTYRHTHTYIYILHLPLWMCLLTYSYTHFHKIRGVCVFSACTMHAQSSATWAWDLWFHMNVPMSGIPLSRHTHTHTHKSLFTHFLFPLANKSPQSTLHAHAHKYTHVWRESSSLPNIAAVTYLVT